MKYKPEDLWLGNQICFPLYATSRLVTQLYTPLLEELDITYPQYLVLLVLWQEDNKTVSDISELLLLESNTLTPLLKRMESKGLILRKRSEEDERKVLISLTKSGDKLRDKALCIPHKIAAQFSTSGTTAAQAKQFKKSLEQLLDALKEQTANME